MAKGGLGTVFVELSLDDKVYKQKLSETLTSTTATAKGIEKSWQVLGQKSDAVYQAQARSYQNALMLIKNSATATQADILRAEQATAAKLKAIHEQQFGHQTTMLEGLKKNWLAATAAIGAAMAVAYKAGEMINAFMESEKAAMKMAVAMKNQGEYSQQALSDMQAYAAELQRTTTIEDDLALSVMATLKTFGMSNEEMKRAMKVAADMSTQTGKSIEDTAQAVALAYNGQAKALKQYGVVIQEGTDKSEVFNTALLALEARYSGAAQAELATYSGQWKQLKNQWNDIQEFLGLVFLKTLQGIQVAAGMVGIAFLTMGEKILAVIDFVTSPLKVLLQVIAWTADKLGQSGIADAMRSIADATGMARQSINATKNDVMEWTNKNYENLKSFEQINKAIGGMKDGTRTAPAFEEREKATKAAAKAKKAYEELLNQLRFEHDLLDESEVVQRAMTLARQHDIKIGSDQYKQILKLVEANQQLKDSIAEEAAAIKEADKVIDEYVETSLKEMEDSLTTVANLRLKALPEEEKKLYEIRDNYAEINKQIDEQIELQKKYGGNVGLSTEEADKLRQAMGERMREEIAATTDKVNEMAVIFEEAAKNIYNAFTDTFRDILDKGIDSFKDLGDRILDIFKSIFAQMATLAIARPIIVPVITAAGGMLGVPDAAAGVLKEMGVSGAAAMGMSPTTAGVGLAGLGAGLSSLIGNVQTRTAVYLGNATMYALGEEAGTAVATTIFNLSESAFAGWSAGIGTFVVDMLRGEELAKAAAKAAGAGLGAYGGATLGTYVYPGVGTLVGGALGGLLGALGVGKLFGGGGENKFTLTELVQHTASKFEPTTGFEALGWQLPARGWYTPIANAYSVAIETIQQSFNEMVFDFANKLPQEMQDQILNQLAATDFAAILTGVSGGRWGVSSAQGVIENIAKKYANALSDTFSAIYTNALADYISTKGPEGLLGDTAAWKYLTDRVQQNISGIFEQIAGIIRTGGIEEGLKKLDEVNTVIANISQAMAPITEIIETEGLTEYELALRNINKQFDGYARALEEAGVDLEKYTDLEKARQIEIGKVMKRVQEEAIASQKEYIETLRDVSKTIDNWINNLAISELAPAQSFETWNKQYEMYKIRAGMIGASQADISEYLGFATKYLDFQKSFGTEGTYKNIYESVMADVLGLQEKKNLELSIEEAQLAALESIVANTANLSTYIGGSGYASGGLATGLSFVGEKGPEWVVPTYEPERSSFLRNAGVDPESIGIAISKHIQGVGESVIHNHIYLDGREIQYSVTKGLKTNSDLRNSVARVARVVM